MPIIAIDFTSCCHGRDVAKMVAERLNLAPFLEDPDIFAEASGASHIPADKLRSAVYKTSSFFGGLRGDRAEPVAWIRSTLANMADRENFLLCGLCIHLIPPSISHVMKVFLTAPLEYRVEQAGAGGKDPRKARREFRDEDECRFEWTRWLLGQEPWDSRLYDLVVPAHTSTPDRMVETICGTAEKPALELTEASLARVADFRLAAAVQLELAKQGHDVDVEARGGEVELLIKKRSLMIRNLQGRLAAIAEKVPGVDQASAHPGPRYDEAGISIDFDADVPAKVLLVDDEREYVQTLSERLQTREIPSTVAFDGEEALDRIGKDAPDVMVLDLKMPGIDGLEVLRRVKASHPKTEVIILTGHGSESEEELAFELGAFAYIRKPADIELLANTMREAYRKAAQKDPESG